MHYKAITTATLIISITSQLYTQTTAAMIRPWCQAKCIIFLILLCLEMWQHSDLYVVTDSVFSPSVFHSSKEIIMPHIPWLAEKSLAYPFITYYLL